jgi:hypothetical protein
MKRKQRKTKKMQKGATVAAFGNSVTVAPLGHDPPQQTPELNIDIYKLF